MYQKTHVIIGPTASGKSAMSIEMAKKYSAEIISADAFQVYRGFNIGTGKLMPTEMKGIRHHLIDICDPSHAFSVQLFLEKVSEIFNSTSTPLIICGGSAMYIKALLYGYRPLRRLPIDKRPQGDAKDLWHQLKDIDPTLADKTPYQNKARVQRYLELYDIYHVSPSSLFSSTPLNATKYKVIGIMIEKEPLKNRINDRVDQMIHQGLVDEVNYLMKNYDITSPAFQAIGYKEVIQYFKKEYDKETMIQKIKQHTYQYAKRQLTWFRTFDNVQWISK